MFRNIIISTVISLIVGFAVYMMCNSQNKRIVVVDAIRLFNGFKMKVELEERDAYSLKELSKRADSLENIIRVIQSTSGSEPDKQLVYEYQIAKANLKHGYETSNQEINEQVWKRLNVLIADFGKENNMAIIVGANGMGSVLYNDPKTDLTEKAIQFVNKVYDNKK